MYRNILRSKRVQDIDWMTATSIILVLAFCVTLYTTAVFPVYPDEIQTRIWLSRLPYDFPEKISGAPACLSTFFQSIPLTMYLPGMIDWLVHGRLGNLPALRHVGMAIAFFWIGGLATYAYLRARNPVNGVPHGGRGLLPLYIAGLFIALFSVGVFPFFLVTNRGEQLILPSVIVLLVISLYCLRLETVKGGWKKMALAGSYLIAVSLVLYGHPKGVFLTPLFIVTGWHLFSRFKSRWPFIVAMGLLAVHVGQDILTLKYAYQCSELPKFEAMLQSFSFDPISLFYSPRAFLTQAYGSVANFPKYLNQLGFQVAADVGYLPSAPLGRLASASNIFIKINFALIFLGLLVFVPLQYYRTDIKSGRVLSFNFLLLVLFACLLASALFNLPKNWYDAGYVYALLLIILVFFAGENFAGKLYGREMRMLYVYLAIIAVMSQSALIRRNLPAFLDGYAGPSASIARFDISKTQAELTAAAQLCAIDPKGSEKVVIDDHTYLFLRKSKWPMALSYIWTINDEREVRRFLSTVGSDGLMTSCSGVLAPYMSVVKRVGNTCCISKEDMKTLPLLP